MPDATAELARQPDHDRRRDAGDLPSVQEAELTIPDRALVQLRQPEVLAASYWGYVRRATLGLVRAVDDGGEPRIVLASRRAPLLRFSPPEYELDDEATAVTWGITGGLLVAAEGRGRGWLRIEVRDATPEVGAPGAERGDDAPGRERGGRAPGRPIQAKIEVGEYRPRLRRSGRFERLSDWLYSQTQLRIHRRIGLGFLRSLAREGAEPGGVA